MPPRGKDYLDVLVGRNPSRLFARSSEVPIAKCRDCLFKTMCLENEKNPTIRRLVLGEEIKSPDKNFDDIMRECGL